MVLGQLGEVRHEAGALEMYVFAVEGRTAYDRSQHIVFSVSCIDRCLRAARARACSCISGWRLIPIRAGMTPSRAAVDLYSGLAQMSRMQASACLRVLVSGSDSRCSRTAKMPCATKTGCALRFGASLRKHSATRGHQCNILLGFIRVVLHFTSQVVYYLHGMHTRRPWSTPA